MVGQEGDDCVEKGVGIVGPGRDDVLDLGDRLGAAAEPLAAHEAAGFADHVDLRETCHHASSVAGNGNATEIRARHLNHSL